MLRHQIEPPESITHKVFHVTNDTIGTHSFRIPSVSTSNVSGDSFYIFVNVLARSKNSVSFRLKATVSGHSVDDLVLEQSNYNKNVYTRKLDIKPGKMLGQYFYPPLITSPILISMHL